MGGHGLLLDGRLLLDRRLIVIADFDHIINFPNASCVIDEVVDLVGTFNVRRTLANTSRLHGVNK